MPLRLGSHTAQRGGEAQATRWAQAEGEARHMSWRQTHKSLKFQAEGVEVYSGGSEMQQHG